MPRTLLTLSLLTLTATLTHAAETIGVSGSDTTYVTELTATVGDKPVSMILTGAALRKKLVFNVYTVGSYVQQGAGVRTAEELAACNCPKQLFLVLERDVKGKDMADALQTAIRQNYASPLFAKELQTLVQHMQQYELNKSDTVCLTHVPGRGLHVNLEGKGEILIDNPAFSKAVWDIYLGKNNLGDAIKAALVSRL